MRIDKEMNILVVEDEVISTEYLTNILLSLGYRNVFDASCMNDALEIAKEYKIDLVFMDININGVHDGIECAKQLNQLYFIPILFTTAYGDSQTISEASETDIFGYLIKPFEPSDVEANLRIAIKRMQTLKQSTAEEYKIKNEIVELGKSQKYNLISKTFTKNNKIIKLTKKEIDILYLLCKNINNNVSYDIFIKFVWEDKKVSSSTIRDTVSRLKRKAPDLDIQNLINFGYVLKK